MTLYLVYLNYDDAEIYESMRYESIFVAFDSEEKAIDFCKKNSDEYDETCNEYKILTEREIVNPETEEVTKVKPCWYDNRKSGEFYWLTITKLNVL